MNNIKEIMNGGISAILIAIGYAALWCGIGCLIWISTDDTNSGILGCAMGCLVFSVILMGSGIGWYFVVKPRS